MVPAQQLIRLANFIRIPLLTPKLLELVLRGVVAVPTLLLLTHSFYYYADFLQAQTPQFYNSTHYEVYDFIVVGGGSAGAVVANRLSLHNHVLLLELGGDPHPLSYIPASAGALQRCPSTDLMYQTLPQNDSCHLLKNNVMYWPRGTGLGGSSNLNFMIYQRGNPNDYDNWANITGNQEWAYDNLLKYFKSLENYDGAYPDDKLHGRGGPIHVEKSRQTYMANYFLKAASELGYSVNDTKGFQGEGFAEMDVTNYNGLRWGTYAGYVEPILKRKNLQIYRYSRVTKIHLDRRRHAYGVTYYRHGMTKFVRSRREVIVSAGAIDTSKLLMLSSIGPISHLHSVGLKCRVNLPVGKNLQDHLITTVGPFVFDENLTESFDPIRDANLESSIKFTTNGTGPLASIGTISSTGFINTRQSDRKTDRNWPDIQYFQMALVIPKGIGGVLEHSANVRADVIEDYLSESYGRPSNIIIQMLARPKSIGEITLTGKNPMLKPVIQPNYLSVDQDLEAMVAGTKFILNLYENTTTYKNIGAQLIRRPLSLCKHLEWKSDEYHACMIKAITQTLYHPAGTCAMGPDDFYKNNDSNKKMKRSDSIAPVVDSLLRVYKTTGLRVIDASVMPVIINSNTNIPSIMIGEIGSYFVRRYWTEQTAICRSNFRYTFLPQNTIQKQCVYSKIY